MKCLEGLGNCVGWVSLDWAGCHCGAIGALKGARRLCSKFGGPVWHEVSGRAGELCGMGLWKGLGVTVGLFGL